MAEIAKALSLPLPTVHRLIGNLEERGLVQKALGTKRYVVGNHLVTLSAKVIGASFRTARRHAVLRAVAGEIGDEHVLPQLPCRRHRRMNLAKLCHQRAVHAHSCRASGMKVFRNVAVKAKVAREWLEKIFHVSLERAKCLDAPGVFALAPVEHTARGH